MPMDAPRLPPHRPRLSLTQSGNLENGNEHLLLSHFCAEVATTCEALTACEAQTAYKCSSVCRALSLEGVCRSGLACMELVIGCFVDPDVVLVVTFLISVQSLPSKV